MKQGRDMAFKYISKEHLIVLIKMLPTDIDIPIDENSEIEILTEEQIIIEPTLYRPDLIVRIDDIVLMIEFQSTVVERDDKKRFKVYLANYDYKNNEENLKIIFLVVSTAEYSKTAKHQINDWDIFVFPIISFLEKDEREIISNIKEKIKKQEVLTNEETLELAMTIMMVKGRENIIRQFKETSELIKKIKCESDDIRDSAHGIMLMLGNMYFDMNDEEMKKILGDYMNRIDIVQEYAKEYAKKYGEQQYKTGKNEGVSAGHIEMIQRLLNDNDITLETAIKRLTMLNCELEEISKITGLPTAEIETIITQKLRITK